MDFNEFHAEWEPQVRRFLIWLEGDYSVIDDVAQETMISAHRYWGRVCQLENPRAWLCLVARQRLGDAQQSRRRHGVTMAPFAMPEPTAGKPDAIANVEDQLVIYDAVRKLPAQQAMAIALKLKFDAPLAEIADIMRISVGSVKTHLHHARRTLALLLGEEEGGRP